jgi:hypothetical protein
MYRNWSEKDIQRIRIAATEVVYALCDIIGSGYHPEDPMTLYTNDEGKPSLTEEDAKTLQMANDFALDVLHKDIFDIAMDYTTNVTTFKFK